MPTVASRRASCRIVCKPCRVLEPLRVCWQQQSEQILVSTSMNDSENPRQESLDKTKNAKRNHKNLPKPASSALEDVSHEAEQFQPFEHPCGMIMEADDARVVRFGTIPQWCVLVACNDRMENLLYHRRFREMGAKTHRCVFLSQSMCQHLPCPTAVSKSWRGL